MGRVWVKQAVLVLLLSGIALGVNPPQLIRFAAGIAPEETSAAAGESSSSSSSAASSSPSSSTSQFEIPGLPEQRNLSQLCIAHELPREQCKVKWVPVLTQSLQWLAIQHSGNWAMDHWMRYDTFRQPYWSTYKKSLKHWRWSRWNDDDPFLDDYIAHPMMGAITSYIFIQNDPMSKKLVFENSKRYWKSRLLRSMLYSAAYSAQWKIGPASEASLEKVGSFVYYDRQFHKDTNGT